MISRLSGRLHRAAVLNDPHLVSKSVCLGTDVNIKNSQDETPLHVVSGREAMKKLLDLGANPFALDCQGNTPMHRAARKGDLYLLYQLSQNVHPSQFQNLTNMWGKTPLHLAAEHDHVGLGFLLRYSDMNARCYLGQTPLHVAAQKENHRMTHFLLSLGACRLVKDFRGRRPFDHVHVFPFGQ